MQYTQYSLGQSNSLKNKLTEPFQVEEIYEFAALSLASMPYRFVILDIDRFEIAAIIIFIKFTYKLIVDFIVFTKWFIRLKNKLLDKSNQKAQIYPENTPNQSKEEQKVDLDAGFQDQNNNHYQSIVSETRMKNTYDKDERISDEATKN